MTRGAWAGAGRARWGSLSLLAAAVMLSACGNSALSAAALRSQAGQICAGASRRVDDIPPPASPAAAEPFLRRGLAVLGPELSALRGLNPDREQTKGLRAVLKAFGRQLAALRLAQRQLRRGEDPVTTLRTLERRLDPLRSVENSRWQALEIPACLSR